MCYATAFLWRISSRKRPLSLTRLLLCLSPPLFCHHILPPPHTTPHKTSSCLLSSFIHPASLPSLGSLSVYCTQKQTALPIRVKCSLWWALHLLSSALPPTPAQEVTWAWPSGTSSHPRREHGREGRKALRFPWGTSLLWVTAEADTLQQSWRQDWGPPFHKSSRSKCSKPFVSSLSHPLPCAETWSYSSFPTTLLAHWSCEMFPLLPRTRSARCPI